MHQNNEAVEASSSFVDRANIGFWEFIFLTALLTSIIAMSIDIMLPALPLIGESLKVADVNSRQLVIVSFMMGFAIFQLFFGPITDRFGRKPVLVGGMLVFMTMSYFCATASDFQTLLIGRFLQGVGAAAVRVVVAAIVRDCFSGNAMGRVMSFSFTAFMIVPVITPVIGQFVSIHFGWRWIFTGLGTVGLVIMLWSSFRLKETMDPEDRRSLDLASLWAAVKEVCTNRIAAGYTLASTLTSVGLFSYIVLVQQIYGELYGLGSLFPLYFAIGAIGVAFASIVSGNIVTIFGIRFMAHVSMTVFATAGMILFLLCLFGNPPFWVTYGLIFFCMMGFGVLQGNIGAISMEPLGHVAGMASSIIGVFSTTVGVVTGGLIGQSYHGTVLPLGFAFGVFGLAALLIVFWTERGKLFQRS
ncbi:MAG: hypothetical protein RIR97_581 [Pseudomonadota bacterium]